MATSAVRVLPDNVARMRRLPVDGSRASNNAKRYLVQFQAAFQREASADYQNVAPSPAYRRTGTLARGWRSPTAVRYGADYTLTLENRVSYAGYVQGPRRTQSRVMRAKGWRDSATLARDVERQLNRKFRKEFFSR